MQLEFDIRPPPRVLSYGGGADSFAVLLRSIEIGQPPNAVVFVDGFEAGEEDRATKDPNAGLREKSPRARKPPKGKKTIERARLRAEREAARLASRARRVNAFPLIEWGWCRCRAVKYIRSRGEPVPRKSACMGCCYNLMSDWQRLQREQPAVFDAYVELERRKPPTQEAGVKMSITGFKMLPGPPKRPNALVLVDNRGRHYRAPPLDLYVKGTARPSRTPCTVCGAAQRETKEVGCGWLDDAA